jgi:hypothetical protein
LRSPCGTTSHPSVANQFSVYGDPDSTEADSSDWNVAFVIEKVSKADFKRKYPKAKATTDFDNSAWTEAGGAWKTDEHVMVAEYWVREEAEKLVVGVQTAGEGDEPGEVVVMLLDEAQKLEGAQIVTQPRPIKTHKVTQYIVTGVEVLETKPWPGTFIPIVPVYGDEVNFEGVRHFRSLIRDAKDANQMFNYWRTTATELVALAPRAPFIGPKGAFKTDAAKWATINTASHAHVEFDGPESPKRQEFAGVPAGALQEALSAADDIKAITGIYDASLGARSNETSGKAIRARQMEGDVSTFHFIDNLVRAIRHTGKIIVDLIPKVYSTARILRVLGEDGTANRIAVNGAEPLPEQPGVKPVYARVHDLRLGRYDIAVTAGPGFTTRREEARTEMIELIRSYPDAAPVIGDILAKNFDWPGADEIAERLKKMLPPNVSGEGDDGLPPEVQNQIGQMAEALQVMGQRLQEAEGKRDIEAQKLAIEGYKAETERMTALQPAMTPDVITAIVQQTLAELMTPNGLPAGEESGMGPTAFAEPEGLAA